jgi:hypothetical protein
MRPFTAIAFLFAAFSFSGCTKEKKAPHPDGIVFDFRLPVEPSTTLLPRAAALASKINAGQPVQVVDLNEALIEKQESWYLKNTPGGPTGEHREFIATAKNYGDPGNPHDFKVKYEAELERRYEPDGLRYRFDAVSTPHAVLEGVTQCHSGTVLNEIMTRNSVVLQSGKTSDYEKLKRVMIFESGHLLPGYVLPYEKTFRLYGIETTVSGQGIVDYGWTTKIKEPIRVVDANLFVVTEVFKSHLSASTLKKLSLEFLQKTAEMYNINLSQLERLISIMAGSLVKTTSVGGAKNRIADSDPATYSYDTLNSSPFGFGIETKSQRTIQRPRMNTLPSRGYHSFVWPSALRTVQGQKGGIGGSEDAFGSLQEMLDLRFRIAISQTWPGVTLESLCFDGRVESTMEDTQLPASWWNGVFRSPHGSSESQRIPLCVMFNAEYNFEPSIAVSSSPAICSSFQEWQVQRGSRHGESGGTFYCTP